MTLEAFFQQNPEIAIAFSGGVDSAYLLSEAVRHAKRVRAYYVKSLFQPAFALADAERLAKELSADLKILSADVLSDERIRSNPQDRCYYCKKRIFQTIAAAARADGFSVLADGTNASDRAEDRPGMKALKELSVRSPLRECGLSKDVIRERSKDAGLFTWNKPAYACLATRIQTGEEITAEKLGAAERAEEFLFSLGFSDFRVRCAYGHARIQIPDAQLKKLLDHRKEILSKLKDEYQSVSLDLRGR